MSAPAATCRTSPSLALVKYWGKADAGENLPATSSLAITLGGIETETNVSLARERDSVSIDGKPVEITRFSAFFDNFRRRTGTDHFFLVESRNNFPTSAGLASSSSGFAGLACGCARAAGLELSSSELSALARVGSASAARSVYGGFTILPAGSRSAVQLYGEDYWPELRIIVAITSRDRKAISSREAMERVRTSSPYYEAWIGSSEEILCRSLEALHKRDLERLGELTVRSYSMMHAAMLSANPPLLYWNPATLAVIGECNHLRANGTGAWETIDAGPQVKILCDEHDETDIVARLKELDRDLDIVVSRPGPGPVTTGKPGKVSL